MAIRAYTGSLYENYKSLIVSVNTIEKSLIIFILTLFISRFKTIKNKKGSGKAKPRAEPFRGDSIALNNLR